MASREDALNARLEQLRGWGTLTVTRLWQTHMDADAVRASFATIAPALVDVHRVQVTAALDAVDDYMLLKAADAGLLYDVTWRDDHPTRPFVTATGRNAATYIARTPLVVLNRIKRGRPPSKALLAGLNYLGRLYGSEAHQVARDVTFWRMVADQRQRRRVA